MCSKVIARLSSHHLSLDQAGVVLVSYQYNLDSDTPEQKAEVTSITALSVSSLSKLFYQFPVETEIFVLSMDRIQFYRCFSPQTLTKKCLVVDKNMDSQSVFLGSNPGSAANELYAFKEVIRCICLGVLICKVGIIIVQIR